MAIYIDQMTIMGTGRGGNITRILAQLKVVSTVAAT